MGLRTKEITKLKWVDLDIPKGSLFIEDSKSKRRYPIPLNYVVAQKLEEYREEQRNPEKGLIIRRIRGAPYGHKFKCKPLSNAYLWRLWRQIAKRADLKHWEDFTPRLGRHYFAATWSKRGGNLEVLRRILRHKNLEYTQVYLSRLIFYEDVREEYDRVHDLPVIERRPMNAGPRYREFCYECIHFPVCGFKQQMIGVPVADCRMFESRKPELPEIQFMKPSRKRAHRGETYIWG